MYLVKTPKFIQGLFPNYVWRVPNQKKVLYLTFDDGPNENITPWVLDQLAQFNAKATFFCAGARRVFLLEIPPRPRFHARMKLISWNVNGIRAVIGKGLCNAPGDGFVIGKAHDEPTLSCHKSG